MKGSPSKVAARISEIQGLRGVAVISVLLFHAGLPVLKGGFLGVDVFFVISGFVITLLLKREIEDGQFSFVGFYQRRARRLLPALAATLLATAAVFCVLTPTSMSSTLLPGLITSVFGVSNFYFAGALDYFDSGVSNPVLHTWSLGVEEQFYVAFPALMVLMASAKRNGKLASVPGMLSLLLGLGFVAAVWATAVNASSAFYLPWYRAWEFLAGALLAHVDRNRLGRYAGAWLSWTGAAVLLASLAWYRETYVFPGGGALLPVLGTLLLIAGAGRLNLVNRTLSSRAMQSLGDASYSIYLAHWPVACLVGMFFPLTHPSFQLVALSAGLASGYLLWRVVEVPMRSRTAAPALLRRLLRVPVGMSLVAGVLFMVSLGSAELWKRNPMATRYLDGAKTDPAFFRTGVCFLTPKAGMEQFDMSRCLMRTPSRPSVLVVGDSLAANMVSALQLRFPAYDLLQATAVDYRPGHPQKWPAFAAELDRMVTDDLLSGPAKVQRVILFARWDEDDLPPLIEYVDRLKKIGIEVTVLGPSPEFYFSLPLILAYSTITGIDLVPWLEKQERYSLDKRFSQALSDRVNYLSMMDTACGRMPDGLGRCSVIEGNQVLFSDKVHFTRRGATLFAGRLPNL